MLQLLQKAVMFKSISKGGTGSYSVLIALAILYVDNQWQLGLTDGQIEQIIVQVLLLGGSILSVIGSLDRKDLSFGFLRK